MDKAVKLVLPLSGTPMVRITLVDLPDRRMLMGRAHYSHGEVMVVYTREFSDVFVGNRRTVRFVPISKGATATCYYWSKSMYTTRHRSSSCAIP